ncbi:hypothetical protein [Microvirga makkahensis]|uniref:DUF3828 domain-containing protein n=1 Tax=Microvirga makkahensis TaxID=1128670 RepID=A0A7X3MWV7_9HYPH|nr:hypothetical protein [Microvirga makkahensis]MXQ14722.1 hypothetical protein [Microvirga makkahensis]
MQAHRLLTSTLSVLAVLSAGICSTALAQEARPWVDPPANDAAPQSTPAAPSAQPSQPPEPHPVSPAPEAHRTTQPPQAASQPSQPAAPETRKKAAEPQQPPSQNERRLSRSEVAKDFAIDYLTSWSARNDVALDATAELYALRVLFHGRTVSREQLHKEKRRFVRRWPEREYRPRPNSIGAECKPDGTVCTVHMVFDYTAVNPKRRRISEGSGALRLIVEFIGEKPVIVAEHSTLLKQTRKRTLALEETSNE